VSPASQPHICSLRVASCEGPPLGLGDYLKAAGWTNVGTDPSAVQPGCIVCGNGGYGPCTHAGKFRSAPPESTCSSLQHASIAFVLIFVAIGVGPGIVDAHNFAAYHMSAASLFAPGIQQIWCPTSHTAASVAATSNSVAASTGSLFGFDCSVVLLFTLFQLW
jgi:hypothetical protein